MPIHKVMSIPFVMCTFSTKDSFFCTSAEQRKVLILFALARNILEANVVVYSLSEGA